MSDITLKTGFSETNNSSDEKKKENTNCVKIDIPETHNDGQNETNVMYFEEDKMLNILHIKEDRLVILDTPIVSKTNICNNKEPLREDFVKINMAGTNKGKQIDVDTVHGKKEKEVNVAEVKEVPLVISKCLVSSKLNSRNENVKTDTDSVKRENLQIEKQEMVSESIQIKENRLNILDIPVSSDVESRETTHGKAVKNSSGGQEKQSKLVQVYTLTQSFAPPPPINGPTLNYDPKTRNSYVAIVFGIVFLMLLWNIGLNFIILIHPDLRNFFIRVGLLIYIPAVILLTLMDYAFVCCMCGRKCPCNVICLILTVLAMTAMTGYITARKENHTIILAMIATAATVFVCLCLAMTSFDFTKLMIYFVVASLIFTILAMGVGIMWLVTGTHDKILHIVILFIGTLFQSFALIMELQMILGGKTIEIAEDDYSLGAFMLYTSIVSIFINLVQMFNLLDS